MLPTPGSEGSPPPVRVYCKQPRAGAPTQRDVETISERTTGPQRDPRARRHPVSNIWESRDGSQLLDKRGDGSAGPGDEGEARLRRRRGAAGGRAGGPPAEPRTFLPAAEAHVGFEAAGPAEAARAEGGRCGRERGRAPEAASPSRGGRFPEQRHAAPRPRGTGTADRVGEGRGAPGRLETTVLGSEGETGWGPRGTLAGAELSSPCLHP
nr:uncharacterized protein LOC129049932 [Pongo abelii]XP_054386819.1 uncharacterized protein LOC129049932 [Pongo abelii]XP_054386823.1 uncharacterized protein LOC129049932 [Pongo abelii]